MDTHYRWELKFTRNLEWGASEAIRRVEESFTMYVEETTGPRALEAALKYGAGNIVDVSGLVSLKRL